MVRSEENTSWKEKIKIIFSSKTYVLILIAVAFRYIGGISIAF